MICTKRLLHIDDDQRMRALVQNLLQEQEKETVYEFFESENGDHAVELYQSVRPDLVLLDLAMPGKNGLLVMEEILTRFPDACIVILTLHDEPDVFESLLEKGASVCLSKNKLNELTSVLPQLQTQQP